MKKADTPVKPAASAEKAASLNTPQPIQVIVRCRPPNSKEKETEIVLKTNPQKREIHVSQKLYSTGKEISKTFTFDRVYGPSSTQKELFDGSIKDLVDEVLMGYNCTIFAYGQTSTGKTFTMEGDRSSKSSTVLDHKAGVIPRAIHHIFSTLESNNAEYTVKVSCLELYNEELQDLLAEEDKPEQDSKQIRIYDDASGRKGTNVQGLEEVVVQNASHILHILDQASKKRQIAETQLNARSSRSHAITTITLHVREQTADGEELVKTGKLNMVDLAGSENIGRSGALNKRAKEAGMINQSLLTLGRVITALCNHQPHVPYRESKLTRLLQDSLGGRTKTCIIATVSPSSLCLEESLSTLDYAHRAKNIQNKPEINMKISKGALIKELATDIEKLKSELLAQREKNGVYMSNEQYKENQMLIARQEQRIEEQMQRLDMQQKLVEETQAQLEQTQDELKREKHEHFSTRQQLHECQKNLEEVKVTVQQLTRRVKESSYVLSKHEENEGKLLAEAKGLLSSLKEAHEDIHSLENKIDRKTSLENHNEAEHQNYKAKFLQHLQSLEEQASAYVQQSEASSKEFTEELSKFSSEQAKQQMVIEAQIKDVLSVLTEKQSELNRQAEAFKVQFETFHNTTLNSSVDEFTSSISHVLSELGSKVDESVASLQRRLEQQTTSFGRIELFVKKQIIDKQQQMMDEFLNQHNSQLQGLSKYVKETYVPQQKDAFEKQRKMLDGILEQQAQQQYEFKQHMLLTFKREIEKQQIAQLTLFDKATKELASSMQSNTEYLSELSTRWNEDETSLTSSVQSFKEPMSSHLHHIKSQLLEDEFPLLHAQVTKGVAPELESLNAVVKAQTSDAASDSSLYSKCLTQLPATIRSQSQQHQAQFEKFLSKHQGTNNSYTSRALGDISNKLAPGISQYSSISHKTKQHVDRFVNKSVDVAKDFAVERVKQQFVAGTSRPQVTDYSENRLKRYAPSGSSPVVAQRIKKRRTAYDQYVIPTMDKSNEQLAEEFRIMNPADDLEDISSPTTPTISEATSTEEQQVLSPVKPEKANKRAPFSFTSPTRASSLRASKAKEKQTKLEAPKPTFMKKRAVTTSSKRLTRAEEDIESKENMPM